MTKTLRVKGGRALRGTVRAPVDLDVAHIALVLGALGDGQSEVLGVPERSRLEDTAGFLRALGVPIEVRGGSARVMGVGLQGLSMPSGALECGRTRLSVALCAGMLTAQRFGTRIVAHPSLASFSVESIVGPLRARGGQVAGRAHAQDAEPTLPIAVAPLVEGESLQAIECELPKPDACAKAAVLTSALFASGVTAISEPLVSADHYERFFVGLGLPLRRVGSVVVFDPADWNRRIPAMRALSLPGSPTSTAAILSVAILSPASVATLTHVGINPSRSGFLDALRLWGANVNVVPRDDTALREPTADVTVQQRGLRGGVLGGELLARADAEAPLLLALGAFGKRGIELYDLDVLSQESRRALDAMPALLSRFGVACERSATVVRARAEKPLTGAHVDAKSDPLVALAALVLGLLAPGETVIEEGAEALSLTYPCLLEALAALGATVEIT